MSTITTPKHSIHTLNLMDITAKAAQQMAAKAGICISLQQILGMDSPKGHANDKALEELALIGGLIRQIAVRAAGTNIDVHSEGKPI